MLRLAPHMALAFLILIIPLFACTLFAPRQPQVIIVTTTPYIPVPTPTALEFSVLVMSLQEIPCGTEITEEMVRITPWPTIAAPQNQIASVDEVLGKYVRIDVPQEMPILTTMLVENKDEVPAYCAP